MAEADDALKRRLLKDKDWKERREAALQMGYSRDPGWRQALVRALDDPDSAVRQAAILSLGRLGRTDVVGELTKPKILSAEDPNVRRTAVSVLGTIGGLQAVDAVSQALEDPDWTVRGQAITVVSVLVDHLTELRIPESARMLVRMLPIRDRDVREKTIRALAGFGKMAVSVLVEALEVQSELVRSGAAAALGLIGEAGTVPALVLLLRDESRQVRLSAVTALGNIPSSRAIGPLIERLSDPEPRVRSAAVESLSRIGPAAVPPLIEALEHARTEVEAAEALRALAVFSDDRAMVHVLNHIGHTYMTVRGAAVDAAVQYGERIVPHLADMLVLNRVPLEPLLRDAARNPQKRNRLRTIRALGELKDSRAVRVLKEIGQENDREIRDAVEAALRLIGSATWARASAAKALGLIGSVDAVPVLVKRLADPNSTVRLRVVRALNRIGAESAARPIAKLLDTEGDPEVREEAVVALGSLGMNVPASVTACIRALSDPSNSVRSKAARSLGRLANPRAAPPLVRALGDGYWSVRRDAENSITNLGSRALPALLASLKSGKFTVRLRASRILGEIGDKRAAPALRKLLESEKDRRVAEAAAESLTRLT